MNLTEGVDKLLLRRIALFVQANMPLSAKDAQTVLTPTDIDDMFSVMNEAFVDELGGRVATFLSGKQQWVGGIDKYKDDAKTEYKMFWDDMELTMADTIDTTLLRPQTLNGREQMRSLRNVTRFNDAILPLIVNHLRKFNHEVALIGSTRFFAALAKFANNVNARNHPDDIQVARASLVQLAKRKK